MANFDRWRGWYFSLVRELKLTDEELRLMLKGPDALLTMLRVKSLDKGYTRLIVETAANDFTDILADTRPILNRLLTLRPFAEDLESSWINSIYTRLDRIMAVKFPELLGQVQQLLAAAHNASAHEDFLRNLAALTHIFGRWQDVLGLYEGAQADTQQVVKTIKKTRDEVSRLLALSQQLKDFIETRNTCYYYMRQAELSVIRMMLSDEGSTEQWWRMFLEEPIANILGTLPQRIDPHQLLIGVSHSLALLEDLQHRLLPKMPIQTTIVDQLVEFLESPRLALYADAQRFRLRVWGEFYPELVARLTNLGRELQREIDITEAGTPRNG
jgi:hypothetical protein